MAVTYMNGFDTQAALSRHVSTAGTALVASRDGVGQAVQLPSATADVKIVLPQVTQAAGTWTYFGFWVKFLAVSANYTFWDYRDTSDVTHTALQINTTGTLTALRGANVLATGTAVLVLNTWYYVTIGVTIADAGGRFVVRVNNTNDIDFTGDTKNAGVTVMNNMRFLAGTTRQPVIDDVWVDDATMHTNVKVVPLTPDGPGAQTQWDVTGSPTNWQAMGDDNDATYVTTSVSGEQDLYTYTDLPANATSVVAVQEIVRGNMVGDGAPTLASLHRHTNGTVSKGSFSGLTGVMGPQPAQLWTVNPATGLAWTVADVNAAQFGIELG